MVNSILKRQRQLIGHLLRINSLLTEVLKGRRKGKNGQRKTKSAIFRQPAPSQNIRKSKEGGARPGKEEGREQQTKS